MSISYENAFKRWTEKWFQFILDHPEINWEFVYLNKNENFSWEIAEKNLDYPWNWNNLSGDPNINLEFVERNSDKPWNWIVLSRNRNITWEIIERNLDKPIFDVPVNKKSI